MTKYVISGYIGFDNFGDEAIAKVLTTYLKNKCAEKITILSSNPAKTAEQYGVFSENFLKFISPILKSDVLISGGGSLLQDVTSIKSLIYYLAVIVTALVFNKKVIIFAQGFTPFRTKIGKFFTKFVLKHCSEIYVRDLESQKLLEEMGISAEFISDPVFKIEVPFNNEKKGVGIQLRGYKTLTDEFLVDLANAVSKNFSEEEIKLFSLQDSIDLPVLERFSQKLKEKNIKSVIYKNMSLEEIIDAISRVEYLIAMRFHALLIGAKAGVKNLGINYDIKVESLANDIGFSIVGMKDKFSEEQIETLKNTDANKYQLPVFNFPEI